MNNQHIQNLLFSSQIKNKQRKWWVPSQVDLYWLFIKQNQEILQQEKKCNKQKIFNKMSDFVGTRTPAKCKSHHQKLMTKYKTIQQILKNLNRDKKNQNQTSIKTEDNFPRMKKAQKKVKSIQISTSQQIQYLDKQENFIILSRNQNKQFQQLDIQQGYKFVGQYLTLQIRQQYYPKQQQDAVFWQ